MTTRIVALTGASIAALIIGAASPAFAKHHHHKHHKDMMGTTGGAMGGSTDSPSKAGNGGSQGESIGTSTPAGPAYR